MHERHDREQYFFDAPTRERLADFAAGFERPCCLCAPRLGETLAARGVDVRILDIDERFASLPGFRYFDLLRPAWTGEAYGLIVCDPPFFTVSLARLRAAVRLLSRNDTRQPLALCYLRRREERLLRTFAPFGLAPSPFVPGYEAVQPVPRNDIVLYSNVAVPSDVRHP